MRMLICNCMVFLSVTALCARDLDGVLLSVLMANRQVHAQSEKPEVKNEMFEHAQVKASAVALPSHAEVLAGHQGDAESVMNNINEKNKNILIEIYSKLEEYLRSI